MITNYFTYDEFFVNCTEQEKRLCCQKRELMNNMFLLHGLMNFIRLHFPYPLKVTSCYRDVAHNRRAGGVETSDHLKFLAIDVVDVDKSLFTTLQNWYITSAWGDLPIGQVIHYPNKGITHVSYQTNKHHFEFITK